ncbi:MAG TPA: deoxyribonuclease IV, partial [bacterium]|nr:deoxyribonuclease IV [bacterium]
SSIKVIHFNDSIVELGSRKDRHQHLGKGCIGAEGFARFVRLVKDIVPAGILETPKDTPASDSRNLKLLFRWRKEA